MKCVTCGERKGKRFCPAKNSHICAQCCGEKRVVEIDCPPDCSYLTSGQSYQWLKKYVSQMQQEKDPVRRRKIYEATQRYGPLLSDVEEKIVNYSSDLRSLKDQHVLEAIKLLKETYRTEEKGLIYEHSSANPLVESLIRDLRRFLEESRASGGEFAHLRANQLVDCLEVMETDIRYHLQSGTEEDSYLTFIKRSHPEAATEKSVGGGLIQL